MWLLSEKRPIVVSFQLRRRHILPLIEWNPNPLSSALKSSTRRHKGPRTLYNILLFELHFDTIALHCVEWFWFLLWSLLPDNPFYKGLYCGQINGDQIFQASILLMASCFRSRYRFIWVLWSFLAWFNFFEESLECLDTVYHMYFKISHIWKWKICKKINHPIIMFLY